MAVIRDVMPAFELFQPATIEDALALLDRQIQRGLENDLFARFMFGQAKQALRAMAARCAGRQFGSANGTFGQSSHRDY